MKLNSESRNIQAKDLIENAVRILVESEKRDLYRFEEREVMARTAQGYLRAAELMNDSSGVKYIDLKPRASY